MRASMRFWGWPATMHSRVAVRCTRLFCEDMQTRLVVEDTLRIVGPFAGI